MPVAEHDLVIRGGTVVDGTGAPARVADVAVDGDRIVAVGAEVGSARREIDADGALVIPGFVDIHAHYDGQATWDHQLAPSSWLGVTTVVVGNCGVGFAPVRPSDRDRLVELMEGVEDIPGTVLHEGLTWEWNTFPEYLDALERIPRDIDIATQVPHGALRLHVMGDRGAAREPATDDDIAEMGRLAREAVAAGALGFSTSRTLNHRTSRGEPTPTLTAAAEELAGIARIMSDAGGVLQVVSDFIDFEPEWATLSGMAAASGRPLSISVAQSPLAPGAWRRILEAMEAATAAGHRIRAQVGTRAIGLLMGFECTLNPFMTNPVYREVADLPLPMRVEHLSDPAVRRRLLEAHTGDRARGRLGGSLISAFDRMFILGEVPDYEPDPATSVAALAAATGREPAEVALDHLLSDGGRGLLYMAFLNYADGNLDAVADMLEHPCSVPGLGDGGAHVGTICDASFPLFLLTHWVRDRTRGRRLRLEDVVRWQCRDTARTVGLEDRGVLAPGYRADICVIDPDRLRIRRPEVHWDLPAGGRRLLQRADGILRTFVAGTEVYADGEHTGALPGRLVRGPQPRP